MPCVFALNLTGCQPQDTTIAEISDERGLDASMYLTHLKDCGHFCIFLFATMGIWLLLVAVGRYCQSAAPRFHFDRCFNRTWERVPASGPVVSAVVRFLYRFGGSDNEKDAKEAAEEPNNWALYAFSYGNLGNSKTLWWSVLGAAWQVVSSIGFAVYRQKVMKKLKKVGATGPPAPACHGDSAAPKKRCRSEDDLKDDLKGPLLCNVRRPPRARTSTPSSTCG